MEKERLGAWLDRIGWSYEPIGDRALRSVRSTEEGEFPVELRWSEHWLTATVSPFLQTQGDPSFELSRWLLRMNRDMRMTRFAYDATGNVMLTADLPLESLDFGELRAALSSLLGHAVEHRRTLRLASGQG